VLVPWNGTFLVHLPKIIQLAGKARVPAMYGHRGYVDAGGLASYSPSAAAQMRSAASYVDRILRGAKPGDLPVEQPTKLEFIVKLKTAKSPLGLALSPSLVGRADEVIQ
jgi:ABC-type uncharacterized transport system substrate-binding protein